MKPFCPVTVMVNVAVLLWVMVIDAGEAARVKLPVPVPLRVTLRDA